MKKRAYHLDIITLNILQGVCVCVFILICMCTYMIKYRKKITVYIHMCG